MICKTILINKIVRQETSCILKILEFSSFFFQYYFQQPFENIIFFFHVTIVKRKFGQQIILMSTKINKSSFFIGIFTLQASTFETISIVTLRHYLRSNVICVCLPHGAGMIRLVKRCSLRPRDYVIDSKQI